MTLKDRLIELDFELRDNRIFGCLVLAHFEEIGDLEQYDRAKVEYHQAKQDLLLARNRLVLEIAFSLAEDN